MVFDLGTRLQLHFESFFALGSPVLDLLIRPLRSISKGTSNWPIRLLHYILNRATYVFGIGNGLATLIALFWAAVKRSSEYIARAKIHWNVHLLQSVVELFDELSNYTRRKLGSVVFLRCSSWLRLSLPNQKTGPHGGILFVQAATPR